MGATPAFLFRGIKLNKSIRRITEIAQPFADLRGLELWDVRFEKEGRDWFLRIVLDGTRPVTLDDCEAVSRAVDPLLDNEKIGEGGYILEVSSPGLGRRLYSDRHYERFIGSDVTVELYKADNAQKTFIGKLLKKEAECVWIECSGEMSFLQKDICFVKLNDDLNLFKE